MTDTTTLAPTDAEIIALADETRTGEPGRDGYILPISFARAVLAKWGTPAPASSQPAANDNREMLDQWERDGELKARAWGAMLEQEQEIVRLETELQALKTQPVAAPRNAALYDPDDVAFPAPHGSDGADALPPELTSTAKHASTAAAEVAAPALDARRYQFLRDGEWRDTELEPFIRLQLNALWDAKIDAAIAAKKGEKP